jgi:hypothetical protein
MMIQQPDSIVGNGGSVLGDSVVVQHAPLTPRMVLSWLPRNATPAQQDSAIQAHFQPKEIRWSTRPDTLHLPGHDKGRNLLDEQLPQYYREGFFSKDSLFHPELPGGRIGVAGDPIPYSVHRDNIITSLLLVCFVLAVIAFANARAFILRQGKGLFYFSHGGTTEVIETANELRLQVFLVFLTSILLALLFYFYTINHFGDTFVLDSLYYLIAIYLAITVGYFLAKAILYTLVNLVFFDGKRNGQWMKAMLFITSIEGVLLFPLVILQAYFDSSIENVEVYFAFALLTVKILTFFKAYTIFFRQNVFKLQIILYFCTLEIVPLLAFWGALVFTANSLKINF